jgi:hypothetical protein
MELKDFIETTVVEIQEALLGISSKSGVEYSLGNAHNTLEKRGGIIKFDVALEVTEKKVKGGGAEAGLNLHVLKVASISAKTANENENSHSARIQFELVNVGGNMQAQMREIATNLTGGTK